MNRHSAHQIAETVMYAAEELRGYMNPDDPFPWELTEDDHSGLLPRLRKAVWDIAGCIDGIAKATPDQRVKDKLTGSVQDLEVGCDGIEEAQWAMEGAGPGAEPEPDNAHGSAVGNLLEADWAALRSAGLPCHGVPI